MSKFASQGSGVLTPADTGGDGVEGWIVNDCGVSAATVLIVDDDADALELLSTVLERAGFETLSAANGEDGLALAEARAGALDAVLLDIMMPGAYDGYAVCDKLQQNPQTRTLPIIVLTAKSSPRDKARSYASGAFQHITKPYDIEHLLAVVQSMVRLRRLKQQFQNSAEKYRAIIDNSPLEMLVISPDLVIVEMNEAFRKRFPEAAPGKRVDEIVYDEAPKGLEEHPVLRAVATGQNQTGVIEGTIGDETVFRRVHAAPILGEDGEVRAVVDITEDVTDQLALRERLERQVERHKRVLREQEVISDRLVNVRRELEHNKAELEKKNRQLEEASQELERLSVTDALTGLHNRRHFDQAYDHEIRRSNRYKHPLSLLYMDIDHFKEVNDTHGHDAGDEILRDLGKLLRMYLRETDTVVRHGGEEFAAVLPETDRETAGMIGERLRAAVELHESRFRGLNLQVTISVGVASAEGGEIDPATFLQQADQAVYRAKEEGRNRVVLADGTGEG